jgi:predicted nucleotidyltransferase
MPKKLDSRQEHSGMALGKSNKTGGHCDFDLLVDMLPGATLFDLGGLQDEPETLSGMRVDDMTSADLPVRYREQVLAEAQPL